MIDQAAEEHAYEATAARTLADAHRDWHTVNGWQNGCPLDCAAASEPEHPTHEITTPSGVLYAFSAAEAAGIARTEAARAGRACTVTRL